MTQTGFSAMLLLAAATALIGCSAAFRTIRMTRTGNGSCAQAADLRVRSDTIVPARPLAELAILEYGHVSRRLPGAYYAGEFKRRCGNKSVNSSRRKSSPGQRSRRIRHGYWRALEVAAGALRGPVPRAHVLLEGEATASV